MRQQIATQLKKRTIAKRPTRGKAFNVEVHYLFRHKNRIDAAGAACNYIPARFLPDIGVGSVPELVKKVCRSKRRPVPRMSNEIEMISAFAEVIKLFVDLEGPQSFCAHNGHSFIEEIAVRFGNGRYIYTCEGDIPDLKRCNEAEWNEHIQKLDGSNYHDLKA